MACERCSTAVGQHSSDADCAQYLRSLAYDYWDEAIELQQPELVEKADDVWARAEALSPVGEGAPLATAPGEHPEPSLDADLARIEARESARHPVVGVDASALASAYELSLKARALALLLSNPRRSMEQTADLITETVALSGELAGWWLDQFRGDGIMEGEVSNDTA